MEILLLPIGIVMLILGWRFAFGSRKKRIQQKVDIQKLEIYEAEIKKLDQFKEAKNIKEIINCLEYSGDDDFGIKDYAANLLGELREPSAVQPLVTALEEEFSNSFLRALKKIGTPSVEPLTNALSNTKLSTYRKKEIVKTLGYLKHPYSIKTLISLLNDADSGIRKNALKALNKITGESFGNEQKKWQDWYEQNK